ncbi:MAG: hypothetical protein OEL83_02605 [Desulforhopalus sp.]|nr:hypothetical protein [Desulforhopalus sp.]
MQITPIYSLCIEVVENEFAKKILLNCISSLENLTEKYGSVISVILTGSFSRGEGSVFIEDSVGVFVLGDMEFIVVTKQGTDLGNTAIILDTIAREVEASLREQNIHCAIEFSPVARNFLRRARPTIFNYELFLNGKVVYGDPGILCEIPVLTTSKIPEIDAFYLLCNRIVEQLFFITKLSSGDLTGLNAYYPFVKLYMDMAGSFLVITGEYEPSYFLRHEKFSKMSGKDCFIEGSMLTIFLERLGEMTRFKLQPTKELSMSGMSHAQINGLFRSSVEYVRQLWRWEIRFLSRNTEMKSISESYSVILNNFSLKASIRGWLKFFRIAWRIGEPISFLKIFKLLFFGPPQMLIYCAAAQIYFSLDQEKGCDLKKVMDYLPTKAYATDQNEAIAAVVDAWDKFIRSV